MHPSRRRKKRPNYGLRTVEVMRGPNGFGFTISGQQPCILSCIVSGSPADQAGLRAGDFLISVNGVSVSKVTHDAVVSLIGNCVGPIKMTIAENYYSDSSDEELDCGRVINSRKPKYMHKPRPRTHKGDLRRTAVETNEKNMCKSRQTKQTINEKLAENELNISGPMPMEDEAGPIEYKALVGYLGTIEMPNQLLPHNRLQTVCSCIRKLRQEKRLPTAVLMTILPTCLTLKNASNHILAIYPTNRVTYIGTTADRESRYFGLVTSATCDLRNNMNFEKKSNTGENCVEISNSCHVFVTDPKIVDHNIHKKKAEIFKLTCTTNPVTGNCLEFPHSALYIVSLIQNMYKLQNNDKNNGHISPVIANSPQPSASSNSDSGIGFRDDCGNISDRILVVEFPAHRPLPVPSNNYRPSGIDVASVNLEDLDIPLVNDQAKYELNNVRSQKQDNKIADLNNIRACEGVKIKNQLDNFDKKEYLLKYNNNSNQSRLICKTVPSTKTTRAVSPSSLASSDDNTKIPDTDFVQTYREIAVDVTHLSPSKKSFESVSLHSITDGEFKGSTDNLSVHSSKSLEFSNLLNVFKVPFDRKIKRQLKNANSCDNLDKYNENVLSYKLSPKTYVLSKQNYSCEELNTEPIDTKIFGSLQDLCRWNEHAGKRKNIVVQSEPDVRVSSTKSMSSFSNLCDQNGVAKCTSAEGPSAWACSFEKLLEDPLGLHTFAEFLKKEFSAENIYFWCACERYRRLPADRSGGGGTTTPTGGGGAGTTTAPSGTANCERLQEAQRIYSQHLAQGAQEAVNVDAQGRQCAEQGLQEPDSTIFDQAQKQIFNLMKFDSYPRYLKSDIYRRCVSGEVDRAPLDARLQLQPSTPPTPPSKLKKSASNAEDRRRKSLLPWHRKNRSKSKDRGEIEYAQKQESTGVENEIRRNGRSEMHSSGSSLTSLDLAISNQDTSKTGQNNREDSSGNGRSALCKVNLSNGSTTVVQIRESETIQELVNRLLEKRGLNYSSYEVYTDKHGKQPLDVGAASSTLSGREVLVERRVTLKLDLPNRKTVTVKSRGCKQLSEVLRSSLHKYQYQLDRVTVVDADGRPLDLRLTVSEVDGMRVEVRVKDDKQDNSIPVLKVNNVKVNKLEEITNKVFEGILQEKADSAIFKHSKSDRGSVKSEDWGSEHSSTFIGKFLRRDSGVHDRKKKLVSRCKGNSNEEVSGDQNQSKKPLIAKLKAGANKLHVTCSESDELVEGLTRAQRRLEDQRGTEINFELPDFLKDKENNSSQTIAAANKPLQKNTRFYLSNYSKTEEVSNYENRNILVQNSIPESDRTMAQPQSPPADSSSCCDASSALHGLDAAMFAGAQPSKTKPAAASKQNDPPPLPPKPKIVPIRPPNWGHLNGFYKPKDAAAAAAIAVSTTDHRSQAMFLEQSSSSFV